jgi:hypothetical protein
MGSRYRFEIGLGRLEFAPEDVDLIYRGLDARQPSPTVGALSQADPRNAALVAVE